MQICALSQISFLHRFRELIKLILSPWRRWDKICYTDTITQETNHVLQSHDPTTKYKEKRYYTYSNAAQTPLKINRESCNYFAKLLVGPCVLVLRFATGLWYVAEFLIGFPNKIIFPLFYFISRYVWSAIKFSCFTWRRIMLFVVEKVIGEGSIGTIDLWPCNLLYFFSGSLSRNVQLCNM